MIKLNKIKRNCVAAVILTMCLMTAGCARNSTSTTTASGGETTITSGITKEDTDVTHADDAEICFLPSLRGSGKGGGGASSGIEEE